MLSRQTREFLRDGQYMPGIARTWCGKCLLGFGIDESTPLIKVQKPNCMNPTRFSPPKAVSTAHKFIIVK